MCADRVADRVEHYLASLGNALGDMPIAERDEIVEEIRSHIIDRVEARGQMTEAAISEVLRAVGDPKELASQYRREAMLRRAAISKSPWVLLHSTLRWAKTGIAGVIAFLITLLGYGCASVSWFCFVLKPFFPSRIGLWMSPEHTITLGYWNGRSLGTEVYGISVRAPISLVLGTHSATNGAVREILGLWIFPVSFFCGLLLVLATTFFARWFIRKFGGRGARHSSSSRATLAENWGSVK